MSREPQTEAGRAAVKAIKSGALGMWANDPDDPIAAMIGEIEDAAVAARVAELRKATEEIPSPTTQAADGLRTNLLARAMSTINESVRDLPYGLVDSAVEVAAEYDRLLALEARDTRTTGDQG
jgi:hypothetical protein